jgi:hypothetical protein
LEQAANPSGEKGNRSARVRCNGPETTVQHSRAAALDALSGAQVLMCRSDLHFFKDPNFSGRKFTADAKHGFRS